MSRELVKFGVAQTISSAVSLFHRSNSEFSVKWQINLRKQSAQAKEDIVTVMVEQQAGHPNATDQCCQFVFKITIFPTKVDN